METKIAKVDNEKVEVPERIWLLRNQDGTIDDHWQMSTLSDANDIEYQRVRADAASGVTRTMCPECDCEHVQVGKVFTVNLDCNCKCHGAPDTRARAERAVEKIHGAFSDRFTTRGAVVAIDKKIMADIIVEEMER